MSGTVVTSKQTRSLTIADVIDTPKLARLLSELPADVLNELKKGPMDQPLCRVCVAFLGFEDHPSVVALAGWHDPQKAEGIFKEVVDTLAPILREPAAANLYEMARMLLSALAYTRCSMIYLAVQNLDRLLPSSADTKGTPYAE